MGTAYLSFQAHSVDDVERYALRDDDGVDVGTHFDRSAALLWRARAVAHGHDVRVIDREFDAVIAASDLRERVERGEVACAAHAWRLAETVSPYDPSTVGMCGECAERFDGVESALDI